MRSWSAATYGSPLTRPRITRRGIKWGARRFAVRSVHRPKDQARQRHSRCRASIAGTRTLLIQSPSATTTSFPRQPSKRIPCLDHKGLELGSACRQASTTNWYESIAFCRSRRASAMRPCSRSAEDEEWALAAPDPAI
jgi:hypothetical protein